MVRHLAFLLLVFTVASPIHGQILSNEDNPSLLDRVLQVVWEPSSLIRMWVGLDQLYNIALSWRTVAKRLASLPFGESRSMDHVKIQEPRSFKYHKPSVASQWDRFNKIYASSNLSPIVADTRNRLIQGQYSNIFQKGESNVFNSIQTDTNSALFGLPPPYIFQAQEVFLNPGMLDLLKNANELEPSLPFGNRDDGETASTLLRLQKMENMKILQEKQFLHQFSGAGLMNHKQPGGPGGILNGGPQERLNMLLKLLKTLGDMHTNNIRRQSSGKTDR